MSAKVKVIFIVLGVLLLPFCCLSAATISTSLYSAFREGTEWRSETTPLSEEVVQDLCDKFSLQPSHDLCDQNGVVYAPAFFDAIDATFVPGISTYDEVQEILSNYQTKLEPPVTLADGTNYFVSHYDLKGDNITEVGFFFYGNGKLMKIIFRTGK